MASHNSVRVDAKLMHMGDTRTTVKLPTSLHEQVKQLAERERRTFNGQLIVLVERALEDLDQGKDQDRESR
jgi:predicted transcriptional regulator